MYANKIMWKMVCVFILFSFPLFPQNYIEPDCGTWIANLNDKPLGLGRKIEVRFSNVESGREIYYTGHDSFGNGVFWIKRNGIRINIIEGYIRYQPMIKWHGNDVVEIYIPTGSPSTHSYFYNFKYDTVSQRIDFPVYYDINNNYVIAMVDNGLDLYDLKNQKITKYRCEENFSVFYMLVFGDYTIKIMGKKLFFDFIIDTKNVYTRGNYIFEIY